jgi:hypothetical protein
MSKQKRFAHERKVWKKIPTQKSGLNGEKGVRAIVNRSIKLNDKRFKTTYDNIDAHHQAKGPSGKPNRLCLSCRRAGNINRLCCGREPVVLGYRVRAPRTSASEKTWRKFFEKFNIKEF